MASDNVKALEADLKKALEAGNYNAAPSTLVNGSALQREDLSGVMEIVCSDDSHIKLQKALPSKSAKTMLVQYDRQLSYGLSFGGTAQHEGQVGVEEDGAYARMVVPMAFYSLISRVTIQSNMVETVDGIKGEDRVASNAAKKIAMDIEYELFRGKSDFSNAGVFDGNPLSIPALPGMLGLDPQVRMADAQRNAQDLMFAEFGGNETVVIPGGAVLSQDNIEDAAVRSAMNHGSADKMYLSPKAHSLYNKIVFGKERIMLAGSPQGATGGELRSQWTSSGDIKLEGSRFLSAKTGPAAARSVGPAAPSIALAAVGASTGLPAGTYFYYVTSVNEKGESPASAAVSVSAALGDQINVTITPPGSGTVRYFNVYRGFAGQSAAQAKFIGRVALAASATTAFTDLNNRLPGHSVAFLVENDTMEIKELAPFSRLKLSVSDLSLPEAHFRFCCLAVMQPRKNVLVDNIRDYQ
jgi:hypothetical protein